MGKRIQWRSECFRGIRCVSLTFYFPFYSLYAQNYLQSIRFFRENNRWVLTSTDNLNVRLLDTELGDWLLTLRGHTDWARVVSVSRTEKFLATASRDHRVTIWKYNVLSKVVYWYYRKHENDQSQKATESEEMKNAVEIIHAAVQAPSTMSHST